MHGIASLLADPDLGAGTLAYTHVGHYELVRIRIIRDRTRLHLSGHFEPSIIAGRDLALSMRCLIYTHSTYYIAF